MAKQKRAIENYQRKVTIIFGYVLFTTAIAAVIVSTIIPWSNLLFSPGIKHLNVLSTLFALVAAAIVPFLVAYIIGDKTTRSKNRLAHHYNGVLLGVMAYWLSLFFNAISSYTVMPIREAVTEYWISTVINAWPIIATIAIIAIIAIGYHARTQKAEESILQYRPYQLVLLASLTAPLVLTLPQIVDGYLLASFLNIGIPIMFVAISYAILKRLQLLRRVRLTHAIIAVTFGIVAMQFAAQLMRDAYYNTVTTFVMVAIGVTVWVLYLWLSLRQLRKAR